MSWPEIFDIVDSSELRSQQREDQQSGIRSGDLIKFNKMNAELLEKQGK